jgi:hypothetical protein
VGWGEVWWWVRCGGGEVWWRRWVSEEKSGAMNSWGEVGRERQKDRETERDREIER